jgi:hypothetical protein
LTLQNEMIASAICVLGAAICSGIDAIRLLRLGNRSMAAFRMFNVLTYGWLGYQYMSGVWGTMPEGSSTATFTRLAISSMAIIASLEILIRWRR